MTPEQLITILQAIESLRPQKVMFYPDHNSPGFETTDEENLKKIVRWFEEKGKPTDWDAKVARLDQQMELYEKLLEAAEQEYRNAPWYKKLFGNALKASSSAEKESQRNE